MLVAMSLLAGLAALGFGTSEAVLQHRLRRKGIRVSGLVVRHNLRSAGKEGGPPSRFAVVEFVDAHGSRHTFQAGASGVRGLPLGGGAPVRYLPHDVPKSARIDLTGRRIWEIGGVLAIGALFMTIGIWMLATGR